MNGLLFIDLFFYFAKRGFTPSQFTQCRRVVRFGIFVSERPTACRQTEMADRNRQETEKPISAREERHTSIYVYYYM